MISGSSSCPFNLSLYNVTQIPSIIKPISKFYIFFLVLSFIITDAEQFVRFAEAGG